MNKELIERLQADNEYGLLALEAADALEQADNDLIHWNVAEKCWIGERTELEAKIEFLKGELKQLANFNPDWDMLQATRESLQEYMKLFREEHAEHIKTREAFARMTINYVEVTELLGVAACPSNCIDGAVPPEGYQCQFCYERDEILKPKETQ
jgi:hypothetical protein